MLGGGVDEDVVIGIRPEAVHVAGQRLRLGVDMARLHVFAPETAPALR